MFEGNYSCHKYTCDNAPDDYEHATYCDYSDEYKDGENLYGAPPAPVIP
ncbi:hypothetical protein EES41_41035 (plasmid) [Streptomyces sp. ADI95-16]|nr:hypothetical protein EES41_41035 [Streptomyces sp. ADI95-16]